MNKRLQELADWIPVMKQMTGVDAAVCIWDKEARVTAYFKSEMMDLTFEPGYQLPDKNDMIYQVLRTGKPAYNKLPKEVFGIAFEGTITPIYDGREIVGAITYTFSSEAKEDIMCNANELSSSIAKTDHSITEITKGTEDLAINMSQVQEITDMVKAQVEEATNVVAEIRKNANYSNILALNASIESARAGQAGRGFAVVSDEMRKFSKMSDEAATRINTNLDKIVTSLNEVKKSIDHSTEIAAEQEKAANELNETFHTLTVTADHVVKICKEFTHI